MVETTLTVKHKLGLHARPAALFVQTASKFGSKIKVTNLTRQNKVADAKSILGVLTIGVAQNHTIILSADGGRGRSYRPPDRAGRDNFGETAES
jgi:phosphocarrier protein